MRCASEKETDANLMKITDAAFWALVWCPTVKSPNPSMFGSLNLASSRWWQRQNLMASHAQSLDTCSMLRLLLHTLYFPPNLHLHLHFLVVSEIILCWCKPSCGTKLAPQKLYLHLLIYFRIDSVKTDLLTYIFAAPTRNIWKLECFVFFALAYQHPHQFQFWGLALAQRLWKTPCPSSTDVGWRSAHRTQSQQQGWPKTITHKHKWHSPNTFKCAFSAHLQIQWHRCSRRSTLEK